MNPDRTPNSLIELNVGGVTYCTTVETLLRDPQSMLARFFGSVSASNGGASSHLYPSIRRMKLNSADHQSSMIGGESPLCTDSGAPERFFIDRNGTLFGHILEYLRNDKQLVLPDNFTDYNR